MFPIHNEKKKKARNRVATCQIGKGTEFLETRKITNTSSYKNRTKSNKQGKRDKMKKSTSGVRESFSKLSSAARISSNT